VDDRVSHTGKREFIKNIDEIPFPARELIDQEVYFKLRGFTPSGYKRRHIPILTSRGCPYNCTFCHHIMGRATRLRGTESIIEEITYLVRRYNIAEIEIIDDIFNINEERVDDFCFEILKSSLNIKLSFPNGLRGDKLSLGSISTLRKAGTYYCSIAIETASPRIQRLIKKNLDIDKASEAIENCVNAGIFTNGFFILGFPSETAEEMQMTIDYAVRSKLHTAMFLSLVPYRGTEIYKSFSKILDDRGIDFRDYGMHERAFNLSDAPDRVFQNMFRKAYTKFYLNPERLFRIYKAFPHSSTSLMRHFFHTLPKMVGL